MTKPFDDSAEAHKRRSEAAKRAVATKRKRYRTWPTRKNDHIVCNTVLALSQEGQERLYRCQEKGSHKRHRCGATFWTTGTNAERVQREMHVTHITADFAKVKENLAKKKELVMAVEALDTKSEATQKDVLNTTLADFEIEATLIHDESNPIINNRWKVTVRDRYADAAGTKKEGTKYIDSVMFGWLMAVFLGGDDCDIGAPLYAKLETVFADGTLPRFIP